jgi:hypothetical protein
LEEKNKPSVAIINRDFINDARSAASGKAMPAIRIVTETIPSHCNVKEVIEEGVTQVIDDIIIALTAPLVDQEIFPKPKNISTPSRIVFKGNLEEVNRFCYRRGWADGLPIIPPTEEAVTEMLSGTDLSADSVIGSLIPRGGKATVEKIAVNAVMAGALPTHLPVILAGVKALLEAGAILHWLHSSAASPTAIWIINGPVRNDLRFNNGRGVFSPGDIANTAIGRAMWLIIKNIGGARKGIEEMGCMGNPGKYSLVVAENEEDSPWEPLHVERGFQKEKSTITEFTVFPGYVQTGAQVKDVKGILNGMIKSGLKGSWVGGTGCFLITPDHVGILSDAGWSKQDVRAFILENTTSSYDPADFERRPDFSDGHLRRQLAFNPGDRVRVFRDPEAIQIIVAGGNGPVSGAFVSGPGKAMPGSGFVTREIELPKNWESLVKKYKNMVPEYIVY